jgi:hypothetical protein
MMSRVSATLRGISILVVFLISGPALAQEWKVYQEESVSLEYRNAADTESVLSVDCASSQSEIVIPLSPGTKPPAQPPVLRVTEKTGVYPMTLSVDVCGGDTTCTDRPNGDVSTYYVRGKNNQIALRFADKAISLEIDAPGIKLSANADHKLFAEFSSLCRKWR